MSRRDNLSLSTLNICSGMTYIFTNVHIARLGATKFGPGGVVAPWRGHTAACSYGQQMGEGSLVRQESACRKAAEGQAAGIDALGSVFEPVTSTGRGSVAVPEELLHGEYYKHIKYSYLDTESVAIPGAIGDVTRNVTSEEV